ncbi:RNA polymerase-associated factor [Linnemannia schmuckeri]|uniref:RNA polymerase-associated factor n=1 Tax=Linnemannia schmuckeri TaxID=64567 RepID=A0A9P5RYI5_9FUNG|nr:RNA polymerase-associated factor [Linnemannia schmuckeri]
MSQQPLKKKYGNEFLCKTRYRNTLPLPPFAPKLLALPSSSERYIKYQETGLTEATAHELILDNQYAMPIDLIEMRENFFGEGRPAHHGDNSNTILNPTDELLLTVPVRTNVGGPAALNALNNGTIAAEVHRMPVPKTKLPNVSWLRRTEYISSETPTGAGKGAYKDTSIRKDKMVVDNSREGQIAAIEKTFQRFMKKSDRISPARPMTEDEFLASLKHPTKPGVTAVESLPIFPDFNIWGNSYTLVTFDVDPEISNERSVQSQANDQGTSKAQTAQRSSNALIKPMSDANDPETWLAYYLPDMEDAKEINRRKRKRAQMIAQGMMVTEDEEDHDKVIPYTLQRDYTYSTNPCPALSQLVFTFREDTDNTRQKSAFYNTTQSKLMLRKKRVKRYEDDDPPITHIDAKTRMMTSDEMAEKNEALKAISS